MQDGKCIKRFPRPFLQDSQTGQDGYPLYRRRMPENGGQTCKLKIRCGEEVIVTNQWIVPHNQLLCKIFQAHINVESCNSVKSIKYICKYINKGSDMAVFAVEQEGQPIDEIKNYQMGRYISTNEAMWRFLSFPIHQHYPAVVKLAVNLENGQRVYFTEQTARQKVDRPPQTTLTSFFELCRADKFAKTLLYHQVPTFYTLGRNEQWNRRKPGAHVEPGVKASGTIGRVYTVSPNQHECFFLRLLLHTVTGPTSFQDLLRFEDHICPTYRDACLRHGLLEDDEHWNKTLEDAAATHIPTQLRQLFAIMLQFCALTDPLQLWNTHKDSLAEDFLNQVRKQNPELQIDFTDAMYNCALLDLEKQLMAMGSNLLSTFGLPSPLQHDHETGITADYIRETSYDTAQLAVFINENEPRMLQDQKQAFNTIMASVNHARGELFFLDAPGGTGKTFLINLILAKLRHKKVIALAVASSGIAATLLDGGRTAHSAFKLPLDLAKRDDPTCNIARGTAKAELLKKCQLIVWDEATMSHKGAFEALNPTLQDICANNRPMGGITVLLSGDFRQTLPIITRGTRADESNACIKSSYLWSKFQRLSLSTNIRVQLYNDGEAGQFASQLLQVGDGQLPAASVDKQVILPFGQSVDNEDALTTKVFPNLAENYRDRTWLSERAILAPKNDAVNATNAKLLHMLPGESRNYKSVDTVPDPEQVVYYPV